MAECNAQLSFSFHPDLPIRVLFDAPETSSDGGLLLLRQMDERLGLTAGFAACLPDGRDPARVLHSRHEQTRQRIFQIALGYEDCNDADILRWDPLLNTTCDRCPGNRGGLSSQPTLSRYENAPTGRELRRLLGYLERCYVEALPAGTQEIILDIDATDDETHGAQQLSFFHGFYDHHMYHPLLVYDGDSGELITAVLRPGNTHASRGAKGILRRLIRRIKKRFPAAAIVVRADAGFAMPALFDELERIDAELGDVDYLISLAKNPVLRRLAEPTLDWAAELYEQYGHRIQRFTSFLYAARTWKRPRRILAKAEHSARGANPRFVITSLTEFDPETLYRAYCQRGQCENWIKDFKNALSADRLSCSDFQANFFRLLLHLAAYRLLHALRHQVAQESSELGKAQFDTLRLRLFKVAAHISRSARRILIRLPKAFPWAQIFQRLALRLQMQPVPT
jgi:hypothetical protein